MRLLSGRELGSAWAGIAEEIEVEHRRGDPVFFFPLSSFLNWARSRDSSPRLIAATHRRASSPRLIAATHHRDLSPRPAAAAGVCQLGLGGAT